MNAADAKALTQAICGTARAAGEAIMAHYDDPGVIREKADRSPVTVADEAAEELIVAALAGLTPDIPIIAEEQVERGRIPSVTGGAFWLVDPLDGTKEFLSRNGEFTVNIALIAENAPRLGVVYLPARDLLYFAWGPDEAFVEDDGSGAQAIAARPLPDRGLIVAASRSHGNPRTEAYIGSLDVARLTTAGSALKFCLIAAGEADLYPRFGRTMEWDTAAGHAVLAAAGGSVQTLEGDELVYGKADFANPDFIARGREARDP